MNRFEEKDPALGTVWREKLVNGTFTKEDSHEVLWEAIDRGYITGKIENFREHSYEWSFLSKFVERLHYL
ncbi:hypothetical protein MHH33_07095 [Paenisporosarcina sp. FSL H8-0542]|uniref:hypothetical protein n=1 Tax=Paenisporosarcina sp. FSL H8-0542 TaxID=2921401 RepID=UPI00315ABB8A